jgi:hypothetical protein
MNKPPIAGPAFSQQDENHLNLLSTFYYVFAGLGLLGGAFLVLHFLLMNATLSGQFGNAPSAPPPVFLMILRGVYVVGGFFMVLGMALNLASAVFLRQRKHRVFSIVVAGLNCLQIPFGTALGVFTLIVLMRESVREGYERVALQN